jgi:cytochrome P450
MSGGCAAGGSGWADADPPHRRPREEAPVHYAEESGAWVVSRYEDVRRVLMDPMRFSSAFPIRTPPRPAPAVAEILVGGHPEVPALLNEDPPTHRRTRELVDAAVSPSRLDRLRPRVASFVDELVDGFEPRGRADLVEELAIPLPLRVLGELLGLPAGDVPALRTWTAQLAVLADADADAEAQRAAAHASVDFERHLAAEIAARRENGRDDLITDLVAGRVDGGARLDDEDLVSLLIALVLAGQRTTSDLIGSALARLLQQPHRWKAIGEDPILVPAMVEETLRVDPPVRGVFRRAVFDAQVGGVTIPAGEQVFVLVGAAGRDEVVFGEPHKFDTGRAAPDHLAFGLGIHSCLGASLARMQAHAALRILRRRLPSLRLESDGAIAYRPDPIHRGPESLPTTWT